MRTAADIIKEIEEYMPNIGDARDREGNYICDELDYIICGGS